MKIWPVFLLCILLPQSLSAQIVEGIQEERVEEAIQQPQMSGLVIAEHYRTWTGKRVLVSNTAQTKTIVFVQPGGISYREAASLLEKACLLEGLVFIPSGLDEVKLVLAEDVKPQGVPFIIDSDLLPKGDTVVSYFMPLDHISPDEAMKAFQSVAGTMKPHGSLTLVENANALIITENTALIRALLAVKEAIDLPPSQISREMIRLVNADAGTVAEQLQAIIDTQSQGSTAQTRSSDGDRRDGDRDRYRRELEAAARAAQDQGTLKNVSVVGDLRTNSIFLMGRPLDIMFVADLIREFDQPGDQRKSFTFKLKYLPVDDFLIIAQSAIQRISGTEEVAGGNRTNNTQQTQAQNNNNAANAGSTAASSLDAVQRSELPQSILVGKTLLVADAINNTLIMQGPPQSIEVVKSLLEEMDVSSKQVQITAVFGRYTMDGEKSFGVDYAKAFSEHGDGSGLAIQGDTGFPVVVDPNSLTAASAFPTFAGGIGGLSLYGQVGENFFAYIRALETSGKFKLLSKPTLFTTNNRVAVLSSGQRIAVPTSTISQAVGTVDSIAQNTTIEFRDVLLKLEVIPLVNSDDEVTLQISFLNDNVVGSQVIDGNSIPTIGTEELTTTVKVPNNGSVVLGGLITERSTESESGIPILSSIPGIGKIFSSTTTGSSKEELVIIIQPKIVDNQTSLDELQSFNSRQSEITKEAVESLYVGDYIVEEDRFVDSSKTPIPAVEEQPKKSMKRFSSRNRMRGFYR
ncbi:secretin N-terminal domain-containing protein [Luteolibacter sp. AS25]|uniref:secretin N-terminal domain-containing protein n=1 Tax=Luteolibacter sp. AS25 TaxID=3135776 RepID=UPI00398A8E00